MVANNAVCDGVGTIDLKVDSGDDEDYQIKWSGPVEGSATFDDENYSIENLPPGEYTIVLVGENGCETIREVELESIELELELNLSLLMDDCGIDNIISGEVQNGEAPYQITWNGPDQGTQNTNDGDFSIEELSAGEYEIIIYDAKQCETSTFISIIDKEIQLGEIEAQNGGRNELGQVIVTLNSGTAPYKLSWLGPDTGAIEIHDDYTINDLINGIYVIQIEDFNGCIQVERVLIENELTNLDVSFELVENSCGQTNAVSINIPEGIAPFTVTWNGISQGEEQISSNQYLINDLSPGEYLITVTDASGAEKRTILEVFNDPVNLFNTTQEDVLCNQTGQIELSISAGEPGFRINWNGPQNGTAETSERNFQITDLIPGTYTIELIDANECQDTKLVNIEESDSDLQMDLETTDDQCVSLKTYQLLINNGLAPYELEWSGTNNGALTAQNNTAEVQLSTGEYNLTLTDALGCRTTQEISVPNHIELPKTDFQWITNGNTVTFTNNSSTGSYSWDFGDGNQSSETSPTHSFCCTDIYEVCLITSNECGADTICNSIEIIVDIDDIATIDVGTANGSTGSVVKVPVTIKNLDMMVSLAGSFAVANPTVAKIVGLTEGKIIPQYNIDALTFNYFENAGLGITLGQDEILFYIDVELVGNSGESTIIEITSNPLPVELGTIANGRPTAEQYTLSPGQVSISNSATITGNIRTFWGEGVYGAAVNISTSNGLVSQNYTNEFGEFQLPPIPVGETYTIRPQLDSIHINGLSTYSLFVGQRFILGLDPPQIFSPYQVIAGDANCSGSFTTLDLFTIQQLIIGNRDRFTNCPSWVFVSEGQEMPEEFNTFNVFPYEDHRTVDLRENVSVNYIGVKVGDILGKASPNFLVDLPLIEDRNNGLLTMTTTNRNIKKGEIVDLTFTSNDFFDIASFQMGIEFKSDQLELLEVITQEASYFENLAHKIEDGKVKMSWFNPQGETISLKATEPIFTLRFQANSTLNDLEGLLQTNKRVLSSKAHRQDAEALDIILNFEQDVTTSISEPSTLPKYRLYQNQPNPFSDHTIIGFELPEKVEAILLIRDTNGRIVRKIHDNFTAGFHQIKIDKDDLPDGLYFYTLKSNAFTSTKSMIINTK